MTFIFSIFSTLFVMIFGDICYSLFTDDKDVIETGFKIMKFIAPYWATYISIEILSGTIQGIGDSFKPMIISLFGICFIRIFWLFTIVSKFHTVKVVLTSYPITWIVTSIAFWIFWIIKGKKDATKTLQLY